MKNMKVFHFIYLFALAILTVVMNSCTPSGSGMRPSTGSVNELLIITNDKKMWESQPGDTIRDFFAANQIGLP
jgi:hypothetical protein